MMHIMVQSSMTVVSSWRTKSEGGVVDVHIDEYMRSFSGDVISRACFGSNYAKGEEIFLKLRALQESMSKKLLSNGIPGMRFDLFLPTITLCLRFSFFFFLEKLCLITFRIVKGFTIITSNYQNL
jgi:hypothetical protein